MNTTGTYDGINYMLHKPTWGTKQPLLIFLHGVGEKGNNLSDLVTLERYGPIRITRTDDIVEYKGTPVNYFVIAPQLQTSAGAWPAIYIEKMIEFAKKNLDIDPDRIYLMGISLGGGGVWTGLQDPIVAPQIAAAVVICGTCQFKTPELIVKHQIPVFIYHSVDDPTVKVSCSQNAYDTIREAGGNVRFYKMAGYGHNIWDTILSLAKKAYKTSTGQMTVNAPGPYEKLASYSKANPMS